MRVDLFKDSSGIGIFDDPFGLLLGSKIGLPMWALIYSETWPPVGLQLIVDILPGSNLRYPGLMVSTSQATLVVRPS